VVGAKVATNFTVDVIGFNEDVSEDTFIGFGVLGDEVTTGLSVDGVEYKICSITASLMFVVVVDGVVIVSGVTSIFSIFSTVISFSYSSVIDKKWVKRFHLCRLKIIKSINILQLYNINCKSIKNRIA